jgi:hypothetical protein
MNEEREHTRNTVVEYAANEMPDGLPIMVPVHLSTCQYIADCFMVNRATVRRWRNAGAPIALVGGRLCAEYNVLMAWLVRWSSGGIARGL